MGQRLDSDGELKQVAQAKVDRVRKCSLVIIGKPETKWSKLEQVAIFVVKQCEGPNPCMLQNTGMIWA